MEPFLKPLSAQEEKSCLDAYQRGDTKARDILVERNLRLVAHVVKKYQGLPDDLDDLISIGTIGLIKAVMTYDSKKGNRLAAYAARCIDNELLMYLRSKKKNRRFPVRRKTKTNSRNQILTSNGLNMTAAMFTRVKY